MEKTIKIVLEDKTVVLTVDDGDGQFNTEDVLRIDYSNIIGELLTFPVVFNRVAILKAQVENSLRNKKFEVDIFKAKLTEQKRKSMTTQSAIAGGLTKYTAPVKDAVENAVISDESYQLKMRELFTAERNCSYIDGLYWSVKSKDDKLKALSHFIPKEFEQEIVESVVNGIKIKGIDKPFKPNTKK